MFDWPEASQTSPTSTSLTVSVFLPLTVSVCGAPAGASLSSRTSHLPSSPALVDCERPAIVTVTSSPGSAQPQIGMTASDWATM